MKEGVARDYNVIFSCEVVYFISQIITLTHKDTYFTCFLCQHVAWSRSCGRDLHEETSQRINRKVKLETSVVWPSRTTLITTEEMPNEF